MKRAWIFKVAGVVAAASAGVGFVRWEPPANSLEAQRQYADEHEVARQSLREGDYDRTIRIGEELVARDPDRVATWWLLGNAYERRGQPGDAQRARAALLRVEARMAATIDRYRWPEQFARLGRLRDRLGRHEEARAMYNRAVRALRDDVRERGGEPSSEDLYNLACYLALAGRADEAIDAWGRALRAGWDDLDHASKDTDLRSIRDDPRFAAAVAAWGPRFVADPEVTTPLSEP